MGKIAFGSMVRDRITKFEGFIMYRMEHMNKCIRYAVQPVLDEKGKLAEAKFFDEPDLEVIAPPREDLPPPVKTANNIKLGAKVKDVLTGFEGIAVVRLKHMYSGDRYGVQAVMDEKGEIPEIKVFDESDLEPRKKEKKAKKPPEGPHDHNTSMSR